MTPTAAQIKRAQDAGNAAYEGMATDEVAAYEAYRAAYNASIAAAVVEALERAASDAGVSAKWYPAQSISDAEYERMSADLPDGIIDEYSSATEGHW